MNINGSYSQRRREAVVRSLPTVAMAAADSYVGAALAFDSFGYGGAGAPGALEFASGGLAAVHGIRAARKLYVAYNETDKLEQRRAQTQAIGHLAVTAGFICLASGMGATALPLLAIGEATNLYATLS